MAHSCPECGQTCYCGGDIDDCLLDFEEDMIRCTHWKQCQPDDDEDYEPDDEPDEDVDLLGRRL